MRPESTEHDEFRRAMISVVMPVYNAATTLPRVFAALEAQDGKDLVEEVLLVDDRSTDGSAHLLQSFASSTAYRCRVVVNVTNKGLAASYNEGIAASRADLVVTMHQDVVLTSSDTFVALVASFADAPAGMRIGATYPTLLHPLEVWLGYNFWQRAMFSRFVDRRIDTLSGKFDCFSRQALETVGGFDAAGFRTAGEDGDLKERLAAAGYFLVPSGVAVIHLHNLEPDFGWRKYLKKEAQIAEAQGALLRRYGIAGPKLAALVFFRQALFLGLLLPHVNLLVAPLVGAYGVLYTSRAYAGASWLEASRLFAANLAALPTATLFAARGLARGRQSL